MSFVEIENFLGREKIKKIILIIITGFLFGCLKDNPVDNSSINLFEELEFNFIPINISGSNPTSVFFTNDSCGYITGYNGSIYKTIDGGHSWTALVSNTTIPLFNSWFFDKNEGFVVGGETSCEGTGCTPKGGIILHTTDGGTSWDVSFVQNAKIALLSVYFEGSVGFAVGGRSILSTNNKGISWKEIELSSVYGMRNVDFASRTKGYIACLDGSVLTTDNGGDDWNIINNSSDIVYYSISVVDENTFYVSDQQKIAKSNNGGLTMVKLTNSPTDIYAVHFSDIENGYAFGTGGWSGGDYGHTYGTIYITDDGGKTWTGGILDQTSGSIESVFFFNANSGFALCGKTLIKFYKKENTT